MKDAWIKIVPARSEHRQSFEAMLLAAGLPVEDLPSELTHFLVALDQNEGIRGAIGLETHGRVGLLRSLVVAEDARGEGLGVRLVDALLTRMARGRVDEVYLLTTSAKRFFEGRGFAEVERVDVPDAVRATREFSELCPASATVMRRGI